MFIDTHAHLDFKHYDDDRDAVIQRAIKSDVQAIITIGTSFKSSQKAVELAENYASIYAAVGVHPSDCGEAVEKDYKAIEKLGSHEKVLAIGEVGLDYYRMYSDEKTQKAAFVRQIALARKLNLPLIVHNRESHEDVLETLVTEKAGEVSGVLHSFTGTADYLERVLKTTFYVSFTGMITFKNYKEKELIDMVPLERLLLETDSPFLTPEPQRGKRNEPAFVKHTAKHIAAIKGISVEELAEVTSENARHLFNISL